MAEKKLDRNDELEADRLGILMLAQAGVHPDFALTLMRELKFGIGEKSKASTFLFADHPRWETREKKTKEAYDQALTFFQARYPDPADSPGGSLTAALAELRKGSPTALDGSSTGVATAEAKRDVLPALAEAPALSMSGTDHGAASPAFPFAGEAPLQTFKVEYPFGNAKREGTLFVYSSGIAFTPEKQNKHQKATGMDRAEAFSASCEQLRTGLKPLVSKRVAHALNADREFEVKLQHGGLDEEWFVGGKTTQAKAEILNRIQSACKADK